MEPLNAPSISHPQSPLAETTTGAGQVPASGVDLGRNRQQRSGQRSQHTRLGHRGARSLPRAARRQARRLLHVRRRLVPVVVNHSEAARSGRGGRVATLRMAEVSVRGPLRMKGLSITPSLRMVEVVGMFPLRMAGVFRDRR
jgi:hypothetical protein